MSAIQHFLLVFDHSKNELIKQVTFGDDATAATVAYGEMERKHRESHAIDIVLVGSDSIETVMVTHANYFTGNSINKIKRALSGSLSI